MFTIYSLNSVVLQQCTAFEGAVFEGLDGASPQDNLLALPLHFLLVAGVLLFRRHTVAGGAVGGHGVMVAIGHHGLRIGITVQVSIAGAIVVMLGVVCLRAMILLLGHYLI